MSAPTLAPPPAPTVEPAPFVPAAARGARICGCGQVLQSSRADAQRAARAINRADRSRHRAVPDRCPLGGHHVTRNARAVRWGRAAAHFARRHQEGL